VIADLEPYPAYKDPGVPWLGAVPEHWVIERLKSSVSNVIQQTAERQRVDLYVALEHVESWTGRLRQADSDVSFDSHVKRFRSGDVLFGKLRPYLAKVTRPTSDGVCVGEFLVLRPHAPNATAPYVELLLRSKPIIDAVNSSTFGAKMPRADWQFVGGMAVPLPPLPEQAAIVRFLDHADRRIRRHIRAKLKLIKLLEEQKQAIIHHAVTRGLDPGVRLNPSGVAWLGDVPEHWEVLRLKFVAAKIVDCLHATPKYSDNGEFPAIRTADIAPGAVHLASARRIESDEYARWVERLEPKPGDILYSREGERFGIAACVPDGARLCVSQRMMVFRIRPEHNPVFVMWLLNSRHVYAQACQDVMGATAPHVNVATIRNYFMALPARDKQDSLIAEIENSTGDFTSAITKAENEIALLREYRTRLIADVVTGKLDVREAAARLPDEVDEPEQFDDAGDLPVDDEVGDDVDLDGAFEEVEA
jgi:type I restriction enzyme, S subunit